MGIIQPEKFIQTLENIPGKIFTTETYFDIQNQMEPEHFLQRTDLILYKKILNMIVKDWDGMETDRLSELLSQLRVLHDNLDKVIIQKKQQSLFDKDYYKSNFDRGSVNESIDLMSISLTKLIPNSHRFREQLVN
jgi:hypothetical protein